MQSEPLRFQLPGETAGGLRRNGGNCTLEQSIALVLDELDRIAAW